MCKCKFVEDRCSINFLTYQLHVTPNMWSILLLLCFTFLGSEVALSFRPLTHRQAVPAMSRHRYTDTGNLIRYATGAPSEDSDEVTKKYGLEAGMVNALSNKDDKQKVKPKDLLAKYGIAYLATSITLAIISYAMCYVLISNGVDVAAVLERVGIRSTGAASNAGTAALAYAVHKAASPIRFPPTVALTPIVAGWLGRKADTQDSDKEQSVNSAK